MICYEGYEGNHRKEGIMPLNSVPGSISLKGITWLRIECHGSSNKTRLAEVWCEGLTAEVLERWAGVGLKETWEAIGRWWMTQFNAYS